MTIKEYDFVYLTNTPSFYKVNLCNEIAKTHSLLLVLYGYGDEAVNRELKNKDEYNFDYIFLHDGKAEARNMLLTFFKLARLITSTRYKKLLYSGWFAWEYNFLAFFTPKNKNCIISESSNLESYFASYKGWLKKKIINRMSIALPSGELHKKLFLDIGFKGPINMTGGVGIFNKGNRSLKRNTNKSSLKYLYVGRLIDIKNLTFLVEEFNANGKSLTIAGSGILEKELRAISKNNIHYLGFVQNEELSRIYEEHDVFILPSRSEPWGLVVDEAIYYGLPVIVSDKVGCSVDLVKKTEAGIVFHLDDPVDFRRSLDEIELHYAKFCRNVEKVDFNKRDIQQVNVYNRLIKSSPTY